MTTDEERLTVVNVVASTRVAEELDLPDIAIQLNCEYEPEQFPGVVYRVTDPKLAILMFRSGRAVCGRKRRRQHPHRYRSHDQGLACRWNYHLGSERCRN